MTQLEEIAADGVLLAYLFRELAAPTETRYLTPDACNLQVGHVVYAGGTQIPRHMHLSVERHLTTTTEVLLVQRGRCEVDIFDSERRVVATRDLCEGDLLIQVAGGHGFRVLEETVLLEIKQGPYLGDGTDKERF